jgi:hypothetical protein
MLIYLLLTSLRLYLTDLVSLNPPVMEGLDALLAVMYYYVLTVFLYQFCALSQCLVVNMMTTVSEI